MRVPWGDWAAAAVVAFALWQSYNFGADSMAKQVQAMAEDRDTARGNVETLTQELADANKKVLEFQAAGKADQEKKANLQQQAKVNADKGQARVEAAKLVTTSTDEVLRKYWEAK